TYVSTDLKKSTVQSAQSLVVDAAGDAWFGGYTNVVELNPKATALIASNAISNVTIQALALDSSSNAYVAGWGGVGFTGTTGAFQRGPQPAVPALPGQRPSGGLQDAFVAKFDSSLSQLLAATVLGGESSDSVESIAINTDGSVIVSGSTDSQAFPLRAPFQTNFAARSGFV